MTHREVLVVIGGLMLGLFLAALDQTIVSTALPTIVGELGGLDSLSWTVTIYLLASTATTPLYGKIGDIYGRKPIFMAAIVIFMSGSLIAGASPSMAWLIVGRGVQGVGAGGLIALTLAIVGDIVSPRERGRYQGLFGAVFGVSSVLGPLLGGFFTESITWRWVFWINVPLGLAALYVIGRTLHLPPRNVQHRVDYVGAALIVLSVSSALLALTWAAEEYGWVSSAVLGFAVAALVSLAAFIWWEGRVAEPLLPLRLFRDRTFTVTSAVSFLFGFGFFGAIIFLPIYLQIAQGYGPTQSGLLLLPLVLGIFVSSTGSGQAITRTGRYRIYPTIGLAIIPLALLWLSGLDADTPLWDLGLRILLLGLGLGLVIQTLVVAVQNAVPVADLGVATSSNTFFRSMGGAFGTAVFGEVLNATLDDELATAFPGGRPPGVDPGTLTGTPEQIQSLPDIVRVPLVDSFVAAIDQVFLTGIPVMLLALLLIFFLPELPLRETTGEAPRAPQPPAG
jgi:EmrB/QacA subfamily drug resistance transporter